jgi:ubiquinone/menaquinone biosynthesis C-methylase UbiE
MSSADDRHSAAYFNDQRDFWFNDDWLRLLARRLGLHQVRSALDVGAGQGHWTLLLAPLLAADAEIVGVEREPAWIQRAGDRARERGLGGRVRFVEGVAERLPFAEGSFDLVTCQTVLMHVRDAATVVAEMVRVVRPGGLVLLSEPNNAAGMLVAGSVEADESVAQRLERLGFLLVCQRGKAIVGDGDAAVADRLPAMLRRCGLSVVWSFTSDMTDLLIAPYDTPAQRALRAAILGGADDVWSGWSRAQAQGWFVAGGGREREFDELWERRLGEGRATRQALREERLDTAGGQIHYLICGRRPE